MLRPDMSSSDIMNRFPNVLAIHYGVGFLSVLSEKEKVLPLNEMLGWHFLQCHNLENVGTLFFNEPWRVICCSDCPYLMKMVGVMKLKGS